MPDPPSLLLFSVAALALLVVPGPAVLYIVARSAHQGRAAGLVSVLGIQAGALVHVAGAALGVSALLAASALAFDVVRLAGAAYLVYLGLRTLLRRDPRGALAADAPPAPLRRVFLDGVVVNTLNPKTALFFLAFLPQFVQPERGGVAAQVLLLGGLFILLALLSDGAYALAAARAGAWLRAQSRLSEAQRWVPGGIYLALGAAAALTDARPGRG